MDNKFQYLFTIFVPCFNRGNVLEKTLDTVASLDFRDYEVILIDDGSTDNTRNCAQSWIAKKRFSLEYIYQENQGKHVAYNRAVAVAKGFFIITLDAGDYMVRDALTQIVKYWQLIDPGDRSRFAGVSGLCQNERGDVSGSHYSRDYIDSDYYEIFDIVPVGGEKREAIRTDIAKNYLFPECSGEKLFRPDMILRQISKKYKFRFINFPLEVNVREKDGYTANIFKYRVTSPKSFQYYFKQEINEHYKYDKNIRPLYCYTRYIRYSFHSRVGLMRQINEANNKWLYIIALPLGFASWLMDLLKKKIQGIK